MRAQGLLDLTDDILSEDKKGMNSKFPSVLAQFAAEAKKKQ